MSKTLLEIAKSISVRKTRRIYTDEDVELAIGWMKGEVAINQITKARKMNNSGNILYYVAIALREGYRKGQIMTK